MTKSKLPVSSFGTELFDALRAGSNQRLELAFETRALAIRFVSRINALRAAMRREGHPDADRLYRAGITFASDNPKCVVIAPRDSEFRDVLRGAGLSALPDPNVKHIDVPTPKPGVVDDPAATFLQSLTEATTIPRHEGGAETGRFTSPTPNSEEVEKTLAPSDKQVD